MGKLSKKMTKEQFMKTMLPKLRCLCQDFNWEVRRAIVENMENIFDMVDSPQSADEKLFEEIRELLDDEEVDVSQMA